MKKDLPGEGDNASYFKSVSVGNKTGMAYERPMTIGPPLGQSEPKEGLSRQRSDPQTYELLSADSPRKLEDVELLDKDNIFLTETSLRDINEDFDEEDLMVHESRSGDYDDADGNQSVHSRMSGVSSISEIDEHEADYDTDLELEADKWLNPDLYDRDTTGVNRYVRMCEKLDIQPITYFLKHMQDKELIMKYHGIGPLGVRAMSDPLEINTTIEKMDLEGNFILGDGTVHLCKVLKDNVYVTELTLSENRMGNMGGEAVCDLLVENKTITYLDLKGNSMDDGVAPKFYDMLSKNTDLKTLILCHNSFEDEGAKQLRDALLENDTLITLDLSWNHFQCKGCCYIAEGMAENSGIKYLNLCMNGFEEEGAKALETMLTDNHTLLELDISFCRVPVTGSPFIAAGLQKNDTLEKITVGYNEFREQGGYAILVAVDRNEEGPLKHINFGNLTVTKEFEKLADSLEEERELEILYGGVLVDVTSFKKPSKDPWAAHVNDPMTKLKEWLDQAGYRLVDLLLTFDKDGSLSLDLQELKQGIKGAGIQMTDYEIELLMQKLDADNSGTIEMKELMEGVEQHTLAKREAERFKQDSDREDAERRKQIKEGNSKDFQKIIQEADAVKPVAIV